MTDVITTTLVVVGLLAVIVVGWGFAGWLMFWIAEQLRITRTDDEPDDRWWPWMDAYGKPNPRIEPHWHHMGNDD